ncbi:WG repeat-containing protein, partial [Desulfosarcina sp. OttesenSCG-928-A07]|nr:WG repeat-containing protein [Desulfosarcina sp. OttesenSCG-928-G17]MDL2329160.1 WG repeat-containing protein [Desulfosarcina sp. OttesenSCG-928-A07]
MWLNNILKKIQNLPSWESKEVSPNGLRMASNQNKYGYLDQSGKWVIDPQFEWASSFTQNNRAVVKKGGLFGVINVYGQWVIEPELDSFKGFTCDGYAKVSKAGKLGMIDTSGKWIMKPELDSIGEFAPNGHALVSKSEKFGFISKTGVWIVPPRLTFATDYADYNLARAADENWKWGVLDAAGKWQIEPKFDVITPITPDGRMTAYYQGGYGILDIWGNWICRPIFGAWKYEEEKYRAALPWEFCIDEQGMLHSRFVIEKKAPGRQQALMVKEFYNDSKLWWKGYVDTADQWVIPPMFEYAEEFQENGLAVVVAKKSRKLGVIDQQGRWQVKPIFDKISPFFRSENADVTKAGSWGVAFAIKDRKCGCIYKNGDWVEEPNDWLDERSD